MTPNNLVPVDDGDFDNADNLLSSLTDIAYSPTKAPKAPSTRAKTRRSRFFFRLTPSFSAQLDKKKKEFAPTQLTHVDAEVDKRVRAYRLHMPAELSFNIDAVREFFLNEIAPITLAAGAGATQAREVVKRLVKSDIDGTQFEKFEVMMAKAVDIKMARFVARQLGLTKTEAVQILEAMKPRQPQIVPIGVPQNERPRRKKETKEAPDF